MMERGDRRVVGLCFLLLLLLIGNGDRWVLCLWLLVLLAVAFIVVTVVAVAVIILAVALIILCQVGR